MRALIVSDIHANIEALEAVLRSAEGRFDVLWNLGDTVGYGGSPNEVIERIRPISDLSVRGNHDKVCCGASSALGFNPVARAAAKWTQDELTAENMEWLREVPKGPLHPQVEGLPASAITCAHGSPLNEDQYILNMRDAWAPLQQSETLITFIGHTHIQGGFAQNGHEWHELRPRYHLRNEAETWTIHVAEGTRHLINPGSIGQPRDCDWRAAFAIYDTNAARIDFHRVPYDLTSSQGRILMAGLPERLALRLREGR